MMLKTSTVLRYIEFELQQTQSSTNERTSERLFKCLNNWTDLIWLHPKLYPVSKSSPHISHFSMGNINRRNLNGSSTLKDQFERSQKRCSRSKFNHCELRKMKKSFVYEIDNKSEQLRFLIIFILCEGSFFISIHFLCSTQFY